jgi:hypothetical protein
MLVALPLLSNCDHTHARETDSEFSVAIETSKKKDVYRNNQIDSFPAKSSALKQAPEIKQLQSYINARYQFAIDFPKSWSRSKESDNGDGISLYADNPDIDIRTYASHCLEKCISIRREPGLEKRPLKLDNSKIANLILGSEDGKVVYKVVFISKNTEYIFYAKVPKQFFQKNKKDLLRVGKSLRVLESSISSIQSSNTSIHNSHQPIISLNKDLSHV